MRLRFLGTGTSFGVPVIGCDCATCRSGDERDRRTRHSALLESGDGARVLVDTPPELRLQLLRAGVDRVDAVWYTHEHADHTHGIDDLRAFSARSRTPVPVYAGEVCAAVLRRRFDYIFDEEYEQPSGTSRPAVILRTVRPGAPTRVAGLDMLPLAVPHGDQEVLGFRADTLGYITDAKRLPPPTLAALQGVRVLVLNALWFGRPHPNHFSVEEAVEAAGLVGAERTYLVHLTHRVRHAELLAALPPGIEPAYDGLAIDV